MIEVHYAASDHRKRIGPRFQRDYPCPIHEISIRIDMWCIRHTTTVARLFQRTRGPRPMLTRRPVEVALRETMIRELVIDAPPGERMSPGDVARTAGVPLSTMFTIADRLRKRAAAVHVAPPPRPVAMPIKPASVIAPPAKPASPPPHLPEDHVPARVLAQRKIPRNTNPGG